MNMFRRHSAPEKTDSPSRSTSISKLSEGTMSVLGGVGELTGKALKGSVEVR